MTMTFFLLHCLFFIIIIYQSAISIKAIYLPEYVRKRVTFLTQSVAENGLYVPSQFGCHSSACVSQGNKMQQLMNPMKDPCDDPLSYSCGGWSDTFQMPRDESRWALSFSTAAKRSRDIMKQIISEGSCSPIINEQQHIYNWDTIADCYYMSCMDTDRMDNEGIQPLLTLLKNFTPFFLEYVTNRSKIIQEGDILNSDEKVAVLSQRLADTEFFLNVGSFYDFGVSPTSNDPSGPQRIELSSSGLGLGFRQYEHNETLSKYLHHMRMLFELFNNDIKQHHQELLPFDFKNDIRLIEEQVQNILEIELDIKDITRTPEESRNVTNQLNDIEWSVIQQTLQSALDMNRLMKPFLSLGVDIWKQDNDIKLTESIIKQLGLFWDGQRDIEILPHYIIGIDNLFFYEQLSNLIQKKWSWIALHDYLFIRILRAYASRLSEPFRKEVDNFKTNLTGAVPYERWRICQARTSNRFGWILSKRYITRLPESEQRKLLAEDIVMSLKKSLTDVIQTLPWMDSTTRSGALLKLKTMTYKIGYPDWLLTNSSLYFQKFFGRPSKDAMTAIQTGLITADAHFQKELAKYTLGNLGKPQDTNEWKMLPQTVNAYYSPLDNEIVFPLSILQEPYIFLWDPIQCATNSNCSPENALFKIMSYASFGSIVGHELTHGFDDAGRQFDYKGRVKDWWTRESSNAFELAANCMINQYSKFGVKLIDKQSITTQSSPIIQYVRGNLTIGENIADNGGLKLAYITVKNQLPFYFNVSYPLIYGMTNSTALQLFITAYSQVYCSIYRLNALRDQLNLDPHSTGFFRIIGPLFNFPQFSEAFQCPLHSRMGSHLHGPSNQSPLLSEQSTTILRRHLLDTTTASDIFQPENIIFPYLTERCTIWGD